MSAWLHCRARWNTAWLSKIPSGRHSAHNIFIKTNIPRTSDASTSAVMTAGAAFKTPNADIQSMRLPVLLPPIQTCAAWTTACAIGAFNHRRRCLIYQRHLRVYWIGASAFPLSSREREEHLLIIPTSEHTLFHILNHLNQLIWIPLNQKVCLSNTPDMP